MISVKILAELTRTNYKLRAMNILPDKWYWADRMLLDKGYCIGLDGQLNKLEHCHSDQHKNNRIKFGETHKKSFSGSVTQYQEVCNG